MNSFLVLGGYGEMGRITVHDLFETTRDRIIVAGHDFKKAREFTQSFKSKRVQSAAIDVTKTKLLAALIKKCDVVINATQYTYNLHVMKAALLAKKPYIDLGGLFHMTKKQLKLHSLFKKNRLTAVIGCGSTPGITNILAAYGAYKFDTIDEIHIRFADHDFTKSSSHFTLPYSLATIFDEFTKPAAVFSKGKIKFVAAMTGREEETFPRPIGKVSEFYTLHSELATFPDSFKNKKLKECDFKVSFPENFIRHVKRLIALGVTKAKNPPEAKKPIRDIEYVRVRMTGKRKGKRVRLVLDVISKSKPKWNASAGAYDTGVPPSIIAQMIVQWKIPHIGVFPPERCIDPAVFFYELKRRGIKIRL
ncbi:saccharopine dehydrogenase NADP-binding domain-containing protein [Candidatus Peregrinibacteria bacterium]|nr:saccharopine dehydrogenase NADP-binding domain-containing protein [Candidatus Peregrinibacteria bacterium]